MNLSDVATALKSFLFDFDNWRTYLIWGAILLVILTPIALLIIKKWDRICASNTGQKAIRFLKWVWAECKDWRTLVLLGAVCLILSAPVWVCYILAFIFKWKWAFIVATAVWAFWWLPGAPFFALAVSITLAIKRIWEKTIAKRKSNSHKQ